MLQISAELLAMSGEAAALVKNGKLAFANAGACALLGADCIGKSARELFGDELAGIQAPSFIGDFTLRGRRHIIRVRSTEEIKAFFISDPDILPSLVSDAYIFSMRSCLMNINMNMSILNEKIRKYPELTAELAGVSHECFRINRILSNICFLRSAMDNNMVFNPIQLDISQHIEDTVESIRSIVPEKDIRFRSPGPLTLYADPALLDSLLLNLVSNSLIHAPDCSRVSISLSRGKDRAILSVDDDGCGIAPEKLHCIFDRYRYCFDLSEMNAGAGLGLTVSRLISSAHGGTLLLESRPGIGTAVRASFSLNPYKDLPFKQGLPPYEKDMKVLLSGLSGCLPPEYFSGKYLD